MKLVDLDAQRLRLGPALDEAIAEVLRHGGYIMGPEVAQLEAALQERSGATAVVSCSSGTDALLLALMTLEVGPGDAVILPAFTFPATAEAVALLGAAPVFADVDPHSANLDPASAQQAVELAVGLGHAVKAIIGVDMYGQPADHPALSAVAEAAGATLIADAAQSFGARLGDRPVGQLAPLTATSFFPAKPLGCYGDGGAVFTDDPSTAELLRSLRAHGKGKHKYEIERVGINGRLDTIQAAVLLQKLTIFSDELVARERVAGWYDDRLGGVRRIRSVAAERTTANAQYVVCVEERDVLADKLSAARVPTAVHYPTPLHAQPAYDAAPRVQDLSVSELLASQVLSLPMHPYLEVGEVELVVESMRQAGVEGLQ